MAFTVLMLLALNSFTNVVIKNTLITKSKEIIADFNGQISRSYNLHNKIHTSDKDMDKTMMFPFLDPERVKITTTVVGVVVNFFEKCLRLS